MPWLAALFFATACLYAAVGFGGGSTYNALLVLNGTDYRILPAIALLCNLIVVTGGTIRYARAGHIQWKRITPWVTTSIPAAAIGGALPVPEILFIGLLGFALLAAGLRMAFQKETAPSPPASLNETANETANEFGRDLKFLPYAGGGALGLLAGIVGIGGGIFLAPVLHLLRWGPARAIAGTCSIFILVNSLAGLGGHMVRLHGTALTGSIFTFWPLFLAVLIGGQIGSHFGVIRLKPLVIRRMTAILILYVSARLLWRWLTML